MATLSGGTNQCIIKACRNLKACCHVHSVTVQGQSLFFSTNKTARHQTQLETPVHGVRVGTASEEFFVGPHPRATRLATFHQHKQTIKPEADACKLQDTCL